MFGCRTELRAGDTIKATAMAISNGHLCLLLQCELSLEDKFEFELASTKNLLKNLYHVGAGC